MILNTLSEIPANNWPLHQCSSQRRAGPLSWLLPLQYSFPPTTALRSAWRPAWLGDVQTCPSQTSAGDAHNIHRWSSAALNVNLNTNKIHERWSVLCVCYQPGCSPQSRQVQKYVKAVCGTQKNLEHSSTQDWLFSKCNLCCSSNGCFLRKLLWPVCAESIKRHRTNCVYLCVVLLFRCTTWAVRPRSLEHQHCAPLQWVATPRARSTSLQSLVIFCATDVAFNKLK